MILRVVDHSRLNFVRVKIFLAESFGQHLLNILRRYCLLLWNNHITKTLPCINSQKTATKTILEDQQPLIILSYSQQPDVVTDSYNHLNLFSKTN